MPFGVTPAGPGDVATSDDEAEIIDFQIDPAAILITRGVGDNAHVVTLRRDAASIPDVVWDSSNEEGTVVFSAGDKVAEPGGGAPQSNWVSTAARSSSKVYAEVLVSDFGGDAFVGIRDTVPSTTDLKDVGLSVGINEGQFWQVGVLIGAGAVWNSGDVAGIAMDLDAMRIWIARNGTWLTGDPSTNTTPLSTTMPAGAYYISGSGNGEAGGAFRIRTIAAEFTQPIPTGFVAFAPT